MALTQDERVELRRVEAAARALRAKKNAEAKAAGREQRKARAKGHVWTPSQRQPRERDPGYLAFLRRLPCFAGAMGMCGCEGATQAAHLRYSDAKHGRRNPGMQSRPSDRHATPLCAQHHLRDQHAREEAAFWADLGVDPGDLSNALYAAYQADGDGLAVFRRFIPTRTA